MALRASVSSLGTELEDENRKDVDNCVFECLFSVVFESNLVWCVVGGGCSTGELAPPLGGLLPEPRARVCVICIIVGFSAFFSPSVVVCWFRSGNVYLKVY